MSAQLRTRTKPASRPAPSFAPVRAGLLQRKCACGGTPGLDGECSECRSKRLGLQRSSTNQARITKMPPIAHETPRSLGQPPAPMTDDSYEPRPGHDFSQTQVHASQKALPRVQASLAVNQPGDRYEREADRVAGVVMQAPASDAARNKQARSMVSPVQQLPSEDTSELMTAPPIVDEILRAPGSPLQRETRTFFESRFGQDFSRVRVHTDAAARRSADRLEARAYTVGHDVVFGEDAYKPATGDGRRLIAHELVHVIQQRGGGSTVRRKESPEAGSKSAEFLQAGWRDVNELGLVYQESGANLREFADSKADNVISWLPQNSRVFVLRHNKEARWYAVSTLDEGGGKFGYIADWLLVRGLPDPEAEVWKIKSGETPIEIAKHFYASKGFNIWGKDSRYVVNALVWVNQRAKHNFPGESGLSKEKVSDKWFTTKAAAGVYIWLPGATFLNAIYEQVAEHGGGTGSISADLWRGVKKIYEYVAYGLAFVGGLVHGFVKSLWDALSGLVEMVVDILVSIFTGEVLTDAKELWETVSKITWEDIKDAVGSWWEKWEKKLTSDDPWTAGHAHGYLTGYIMAEAAQLLISGGTLQAAKGALWSSRLGKAIQGTRGFKAFVKGVEKVSEPASKAGKVVETAGKALKTTRVFNNLHAAKLWAVNTLKLGTEIAKDLTLEGINRLGRLPEAAWNRIAGFSQSAKRVLLGCFSPCKCDTDAIKKTLDSFTDEDIERTLSWMDKLAREAGEDAAKAGKPKKAAQKTAQAIRIRVEEVVQQAMTLLKERGIKGLPPSEYGTKLAGAVNEILRPRLGKASSGWIAGSEKSLGSLVKLSSADAGLTVRQYMNKWGMTDRYPTFADDFLKTKIKDLKPDLYVKSPDGRALVWDVTSQPDARHIGKTMFYSEVLARETGGIYRVSESYWKELFFTKVEAAYPGKLDEYADLMKQGGKAGGGE